MKKLLIFICCLSLFFVSSVPVFGQDQSLEDKIKELMEKIDQAQTQERTLNNEIAKIDNQIKLTELNIQKTEKEIKKLGEEIIDLSGKIEKLEASLSHLLVLFSNRVVNSYKTIKTSYLTLLFSSSSLSELLSRSKYIQMAQVNDQQVMIDVQKTKVEYKDQKDKREEKKTTQETLKKQLQTQKITLNNQSKSKQILLEQTKNDEATYQRQLQQALAEKRALDAAIINGVKVGPVKQGDIIGLVGNTGWHPNPNLSCSTGKHLHFEIQKNNTWIDPTPYLQSKTVEDRQNGNVMTTMGSGSWPWPIQDTILLTQHYGHTPYSYRYKYSGEIHTGLDMYSSSSDVIKAPSDGNLFKYSQLCVPGGNNINIIYIEHGDGLISFYLHVQ